MELEKKVYKAILKLSKKGNKLLDKGNFEEAEKLFLSALELVPEPKSYWEASTWILGTLSEIYFLQNNFSRALKYLYDAYNCPNGTINPFILLRLGECLFELEDIEKSKNFLLQAYMLEGEEIFSDEDKKYFNVIKELTSNNIPLPVEPELSVKKTLPAEQTQEQKELTTKLEKLRIKAGKEYQKRNYEKGLIFLEEAWSLLPGDKFFHPESFHIVVDFINTFLELKDYENAKQWGEKLFKADPERIDADREFINGKIAYEMGDLEKAKEYFMIANKASGGICFIDEDKKYKKLIK